jgi:hypothetical protein
MGEMRNLYKILVRKRDDKRRLGRLTYRWNGNIEMDLNEMVGGSIWTGFIWYRITSLLKKGMVL